MWKLPTPLAGAVSPDGYTVLSYTTKAIVLDPFGKKLAEVKEESQNYTIRDVGIAQKFQGYFILLKRSFDDLLGYVSVYTLDRSNLTEIATILSREGFNYHGRNSYLVVWNSRMLHVINETYGLVWTKRSYGSILGASVVPKTGFEQYFGVVSEKYIAFLDEEGEPVWKIKKPDFIERVNGVITTYDEEIGVAYTDPDGRNFISLFSNGEEVERISFPFGRVLDLADEYALGEFGFTRWRYPSILKEFPEDLREEEIKRFELKIPTPKAEEGKILADYLLLKTENGYELFSISHRKTIWKRKALKVKGNWTFILAMGPDTELLSLAEAAYGKVKVPIPPHKMIVSDYGKVAIVHKLLNGFLLQVFSKEGEKIFEKRYDKEFRGIKFCGDEPVVFWNESFTTFAEFKGELVAAKLLDGKNIFDCSADGNVKALLKDDVVSVIVNGELKWIRQIDRASEVFVSRDGKVVYVKTRDKIIAFSKEGRRIFSHEVPTLRTFLMVLDDGIIFEVSPEDEIIVTKKGVRSLNLGLLTTEISKYGFALDVEFAGGKRVYKIYDLNSGKSCSISGDEGYIYPPVLSPTGRYLAYINERYDIRIIELPLR